MIAIVDYGAGNVQSVRHALQRLGQSCVLTEDPQRILAADGVILPGVGAFGAAMGQLRARGLVEPLRRVIAQGKPFLGICIGLQLLFDESTESPDVQGLGFLPGAVKKIPANKNACVKVPHMGWNQIASPAGDPLFEGLPAQPWFYFVHSYYADAANKENVTATLRYGACDMDVAVRRGNLWAVQFHPEKSGDDGRKLLANFCALCAKEGA